MLIARWAVVGAASGIVGGGIVGLAVGLSAYPPTASFAVFELCVPAGIAGAIIRLAGALVVFGGPAGQATHHTFR